MKTIHRSHIPRLIWAVSLVALLDLVPAVAMAGELTANDAQTFTVYFENDAFFGTDNLYTNGVRLSWTSPDLETCRDTSTLGSGAYSLVGCPANGDVMLRGCLCCVGGGGDA